MQELIENPERVKSIDFRTFEAEAGKFTVADIREELLKPGRDPRDKFVVPKFRDDVKEIADLKEGMELEGTVTNVTNFGAFVDLGVHQDGLVHISELSHKYIQDARQAVKVGDIVKVKVIGVDPTMKRISLSMKALLRNHRDLRAARREWSKPRRPGRARLPRPWFLRAPRGKVVKGRRRNPAVSSLPEESSLEGSSLKGTIGLLDRPARRCRRGPISSSLQGLPRLPWRPRLPRLN